MEIGIRLTLDRPPPPDPFRSEPVKPFGSKKDGIWVPINDIFRPKVEKVLSLLGREGIGLIGFGMQLIVPVDGEREWWDNLDDAVIAANLDAKQIIGISADNVFELGVGQPCYGLVDKEFPIHVLEKPPPREHVVSVALGGERIFSQQICSLLDPRREGKYRDVICLGERLAGWCRYLPKDMAEVISPECLLNSACLGCLSRTVADCGVLLGSSRADLLVCQETRGTGHAGKDHRYIISTSIAQHLLRSLGRGFALDPIIDLSSRYGRRILDVLQMIRELLEKTGYQKCGFRFPPGLPQLPERTLQQSVEEQRKRMRKRTRRRNAPGEDKARGK